jgi:hypothetical protein
MTYSQNQFREKDSILLHPQPNGMIKSNFYLMLFRSQLVLNTPKGPYVAILSA